MILFNDLISDTYKHLFNKLLLNVRQKSDQTALIVVRASCVRIENSILNQYIKTGVNSRSTKMHDKNWLCFQLKSLASGWIERKKHNNNRKQIVIEMYEVHKQNQTLTNSFYKFHSMRWDMILPCKIHNKSSMRPEMCTTVVSYLNWF